MNEECMAPYRSLVAALLSQALMDMHHANPQVRREARQWLRRDMFCREICEWLGYSHTTLQSALERQTPDDKRGLSGLL
jgi:IS30 family transposase